METFKEIPSFPDYLISNFGRVKTKSRPLRYIHAVTGQEHFRNTEARFLKVQYNNRTGYKFHQLYRGKKAYQRNIHSLVAEVFLPDDPTKPVINHKDGNKHNNVSTNLERCTNSYNHEHATRTGLKAKGEQIGNAKLNNKMAHAIKYFYNKGFSHVALAEAFQVSRPTISLICEGKLWKHVALTGEELNQHPDNKLSNNSADNKSNNEVPPS